MSIWSKSITKDGAFWGMISGFVFNVVPTILDFTGVIDLPSYLNPILIGAAVSLVVTIGVSRSGTVTRNEQLYRLRLHRTPEDERRAGRTGVTLLAPVILIAYGCVMPFVMQHWYVKPYQHGTDEIMADGSINWATGEAMLSLSWALLYVPLGLIAYRLIRNAYRPGA
jgi:sodium/pantothenate symporter